MEMESVVLMLIFNISGITNILFISFKEIQASNNTNYMHLHAKF